MRKAELTRGRSIESVQVHMATVPDGSGRTGLIVDPLRDGDFELMGVLTVKYLEQIADHWPTDEPLDKEHQRELYDAASLVNVLLFQLRRGQPVRRDDTADTQTAMESEK
jgi:hypothetical protein